MAQKLTFLYIYLTDECNLRCIHCWQSAPLEGKGKISRLIFDECKKFLDDTLEMGLKNITFSGGEPLLNREFHKFARYFHENSIFIALETNGILISDPDILNTIKHCNIYCAVSLDGVNPETHNKYRGLRDAYQRTVKSLDMLDREEIGFELIMTISKYNYHELVPLFDSVKERWKHCSVFKINVVHELGRAGAMSKKGLLFKGEEFPKIAEDISPLVGKYPFQIMLHMDPLFLSFKNLMKKYHCGGNCGYSNSLSVLANGNVSVCSLGKQIDKYIFGHVSAVDVKHVWENNPILVDIHDNVHTKLKGICSNCIFRKECLGGCRAAALQAYGDFFAPEPRCQSYYDSGNVPKSRLIHAAD